MAVHAHVFIPDRPPSEDPIRVLPGVCRCVASKMAVVASIFVCLLAKWALRATPQCAKRGACGSRRALRTTGQRADVRACAACASEVAPRRAMPQCVRGRSGHTDARGASTVRQRRLWRTERAPRASGEGGSACSRYCAAKKATGRLRSTSGVTRGEPRTHRRAQRILARALPAVVGGALLNGGRRPGPRARGARTSPG